MSKANEADDAPNPEDQKINEEYKIWKKNTPFLYDTIMTHALEWPSLTCEWMPVSNELIKAGDAVYTEQKILLGTHTSEDEDNNLLIAKVCLPVDQDEETHEEDKAEGSHGAAPPAAKIEIFQKIIHQGEVNRARYMPQNPFFVATKSAGPDVFVFDTSKHASDPGANKTFNPQIRCKGHEPESEGYGLAWSSKKEGYLLSGSDDKNVLLWNIEGCSSAELGPLAKFEGHTSVVEDVEFHHHNPDWFGSVGDDQMLMIWDMRDPTKAQQKVQAHEKFVNCLSFNPHTEYSLLTGSEDHTVALWDLRKLAAKMHTFETHVDEVFCVEWAPFSETVFASASSDRRVNVWDLKKIGAEQCEEDKEDGPPELLFIHGGHTSKISDISWNPNANAMSEWFMASVAEDNVLQAWHMASNVYEEDDDDDAEKVKNEDLE